MNLGQDIQDDLLYSDELERVTVRDKGNNTTSTNVGAVKSSLSDRELMAVGYEPTDVAWRLVASTCRVVPSQGDFIHDRDGNDWTVLSVAPSMVGNVAISYRCACRKQV